MLGHSFWEGSQVGTIIHVYARSERNGLRIKWRTAVFHVFDNLVFVEALWYVTFLQKILFPGAPLVKSPPVASSSFFPQGPGLTQRTKLMLGVGFCGSFTTFSTYSVDILTWLQNGQGNRVLLYVLSNNIGGVAAAAAGFSLVRKIFGPI